MGTQRTISNIASLACLLIVSVVTSAQDHDAMQHPSSNGANSSNRPATAADYELAQKMFRRGNTYSNLARHEDAIDEYRKAISADPNFADAIRNLANTYYYLERFGEAKTLLKRYIDLETRAEPVTTASLIASVSTLAELERKQGNYQNSITYNLQAITLDPDNDSQVHVMANTYNNAGHADKAIQIYQAAIAVMPGNAFFNRSLGRILEQEDRLQEALTAYEAAAEKDPESDFYKDLVKNTQARLNR